MAVFNNSDGSQSTVDMMSGKQAVEYYSADDYEAFSLAYKDTNIRYMVILPREGVSGSDVINNFTSHELAGITKLAKSGYSTISMPKVNLKSDILVSNAYAGLGITDLIKTGRFPAISESMSADGLAITQRSVFNVTEKEAIAASVSQLGYYTAGAPDESIPSEIVVNRPYIFMVYDDNATDAIIIFGRVYSL